MQTLRSEPGHCLEIAQLKRINHWFGDSDAGNAYEGPCPSGDPTHFTIVTRDGAGKYVQQPIEIVRNLPTSGGLRQEVRTTGPAETVMINGMEDAKSWQKAVDRCTQQREARAFGDP